MYINILASEQYVELVESYTKQTRSFLNHVHAAYSSDYRVCGKRVRFRMK